ncbi:hypothetical protein M0802_000668 [Mischocyttarus mexicanus]|nr:hypothetical protein M0802_000668 [Mischocyttarus mexicanus]
MPTRATSAAGKTGDMTKSVKITDVSLCGVPSPGPKYKLKTLVGHKNHCISKYRNPAFTFGLRETSEDSCRSPGPKYMLPGLEPNGFKHGLPLKITDKSVSPGPKYSLPPSRSGPMFSLKWRTKYKKGCVTPGPYNVKHIFYGPSFSIGLRIPGLKCVGGPGPSVPYNLDMIKPVSPMFTIGLLQSYKGICRSPGPKYNPKRLDLSPQYSFGVKHSICLPPNITECDDRC